MSKKVKNSKVFVAEIVWDTIGGAIALFGLVLMVFGVIGHFMGGSLANNFIKTAEADLASAINVDLGFSIWGILFFILGVAIIVISLAVNAKKADRDLDKASRRQQRLAASTLDIEVRPAVETVPAEPVSAPAVDAAPVDEKKAD